MPTAWGTANQSVTSFPQGPSDPPWCKPDHFQCIAAPGRLRRPQENEIGVTVALAAIVATMAMPSLGGLIAQSAGTQLRFGSQRSA